MIKIFTLHWNAKPLLERLYVSLLPALKGLDYCWYIKDNGSNDGSKEFLESIKSNNIVPYYTGHNRHNFAEGMNILFDLARPADDDYILLLNNDLWVIDDKSLKNMINIMEKDSWVGLVGGKILYPDGDTITHVGVIGSAKYNFMPFHYRRGDKVNKQDNVNREFQACTAAVCLTKSKYFKQVCTANKSGISGMCESFIWSFDDIDMNLSIKYNMGKKIVYCGDTLFYHNESSSLKLNPVNKLFVQSNVKLFKDKWGKTFQMDLEIYQNNPNYMLYVPKH